MTPRLLSSSHNSRSRQPKRKNNLRLFTLFFILFILLLAFCARLLYLQFFDQDFLSQQSQVISSRTVVLPSLRGSIFDRNGEALAVSAPVYSVAIDPQQIHLSNPVFLRQLKQMTKLLAIDYRSTYQTIKRHRKRHFVYIKRQVMPKLVEDLKQLSIPGLLLKPDNRRFYPHGALFGPLLGMTDIDGRGQEGVELSFDHKLQGKNGLQQVYQDGYGRAVTVLPNQTLVQHGQDLHLSIDRRIQHIASMALNKALKRHRASSGSVVVLDVKNHNILAMLSAPSFNPNNRRNLVLDTVRNRAVTDTFEPGSVIKPFAMAYALAEGKFSPTDTIQTAPGWFKIGDQKIRDVRNFNRLSMSEIIQKSSNVGIAKMMQKLSADQFLFFLSRFGFGQLSFSGLPGERSGQISTASNTTKAQLASLAFGYGLSVTTLQLAQAYATLASKGVHYPVSILKSNNDHKPQGRRILSATVASDILKMLETVTSEGGTAVKARLDDYRVAAKTGTVRQMNQTGTGYRIDRHSAVFAGIVPASNPRLVIALVIHNPQGRYYYSSQVAAPVFAQIAKRSLRLLNISPDRNTS